MTDSGLLHRPDTLRTSEQLDIELQAAELLADPGTQAIKDEVAKRWVDAVQPDAELQSLFVAEFEQVAFCSAMNAINSDPCNPRIHAFGRLEHGAPGSVRIPMTKTAHPCADYVYRFIPVAAGNEYVVEGTRPSGPAVAFEFGVIDEKQNYQGTVSAHELITDEYGRFRITIGPNAENGRPNHIRTSDGACRVIVRDVLGDVAIHAPYALGVRRVGGKAVAKRVDLLARFGIELRKFVDELLAATALGMSVTKGIPNHFESPVLHKNGTFLITQAYSPGRIALRDDEAMVLNLQLGDAAYAVVPVTNGWGGVGRFLDHVNQLGTGRAVPNPDGSFTFVIAHQDPGTHNWIDLGGVHEGIAYVRWVGFDPRKASGHNPTLASRLVSIGDVGDELPVGCPMITATERIEQRKRHRADYLSALG